MGEGEGKKTFDAARNMGDQRIEAGRDGDRNPVAAPRRDLRAIYVASVVARLANVANQRQAKLAGAQRNQVLQLGPVNTNATFAIGLLVNDNGRVARLIPAAKGVSGQLVAFYASLVRMVVNNCHYELFELNFIPDVAETANANDAGLHAEMAVVGSIEKKMARARLGVICIGRRVCANCGGQMNGYGIPHGSVIIDSTTGTNAPVLPATRQPRCGRTPTRGPTISPRPDRPAATSIRTRRSA